VHVLAVSDEVDDALCADLRPVRTAQLILACGDLPFDYLGYLMNALDVPLVFVAGNHDPDLSGYRTSRAGLSLRAGFPQRPPWPDGAVSAELRIVDVAGLRVAGLGGCRRYRDGPNQYSKIRDRRSIDVLLTHAPPRGVGDGDDPPHQGFTALNGLVARLQPALLLHGHVRPAEATSPDRRLGRTVVRNVTGRHLLDIEPGARIQHSAAGSRDAS
jgi:calcineurin-like phosphoesterase family protein